MQYYNNNKNKNYAKKNKKVMENQLQHFRKNVLLQLFKIKKLLTHLRFAFVLCLLKKKIRLLIVCNAKNLATKSVFWMEISVGHVKKGNKRILNAIFDLIY